MNILRILRKPIVFLTISAVITLVPQATTPALADLPGHNVKSQNVASKLSALPVNQAINLSSRAIPFRFEAIKGHRYQLVLSRSATLVGGVTKIYQSPADKTVTEYAVAPASGTWFTAVQQVAPSLDTLSSVRRVNVKAGSAKALTLVMRQDRNYPARISLASSGSKSNQLLDVRIKSQAKNSQPYVLQAVLAQSLVLPSGTWNISIRRSGTNQYFPSPWSASRKIKIIGNPRLAKPAPPEHAGKDPMGNPKIKLHLKAGIDYWVIQGQNLLSPIPRVAKTSVQSVAVKLPCETVAPARVIAVNALGEKSQLSSRITLTGSPCREISALEPPDNLQVEDATFSSVTLSFNPLPRTNQSFLLNRDTRAVGSIPGKQGTITLNGLSDSVSYQWDLYRKNAQGFISPRPASLIVATEPPVLSTGTVRAFMLTTDMVSISDAREHYMALDWVYPTYFDIHRPTSGPAVITGESQPRVDTWFQKRGVKVLPRILASDLPTLETMWATAELREAFANDVLQIVSEGNYDGIQLDFEPLFPKLGIPGSGHSETPVTRAVRYAMMQTDVVKRISELLTPLGKKVSFAIPINWCSAGRSQTTWRPVYCNDINNKSVVTRPRMQLYDVPGILKYSDDIFVMSWGQHWGNSEPGASGELDWIQAGVNWLKGVIAQQISADPTSVRAEITLGRNLYSSVYYYTIARTDTARPPVALPKAPLCPKTQVAARARLRTPKDGSLVVDWACPELRSDKLEYTDAIAVGKTSASPRGKYQSDDGETLVTLPDKDGFYAELWLADVRSEIDFIDITKDAGWKIGFWRLGREDQRIWDLPEVVASK